MLDEDLVEEGCEEEAIEEDVEVDVQSGYAVKFMGTPGETPDVDSYTPSGGDGNGAEAADVVAGEAKAEIEEPLPDRQYDGPSPIEADGDTQNSHGSLATLLQGNEQMLAQTVADCTQRLLDSPASELESSLHGCCGFALVCRCFSLVALRLGGSASEIFAQNLVKQIVGSIRDQLQGSLPLTPTVVEVESQEEKLNAVATATPKASAKASPKASPKATPKAPPKSVSNKSADNASQLAALGPALEPSPPSDAETIPGMLTKEDLKGMAEGSGAVVW